MKALLTDTQLFQLLKALREVRKVVIMGHRGPDGDALGSSLGWADYLKSIGKSVRIVMPNPFPDYYKWLPNAESVIFYEHRPDVAKHVIHEADLICLLDFNTLHRIQDLGDVVKSSKATRLMIDHHLQPDRAAADIVLSFPEMSSTSEIVFRLIEQLGGYEAMTAEGAAALYCGMMTDTGGFTYNSSNPEIYIIISKLLEKGIDKDKIYRNVYHTFSASRIRFQGYILYEKLKFYANNRASLFTITREDMKTFNFIRGDAEGIVNMPLQVKGMRLSISLREDTDKDVIRVSLRSVDDFPCNKMAEEFFNGGGHLNASGGELPFPLDEAMKTVEKAIEKYSELL